MIKNQFQSSQIISWTSNWLWIIRHFFRTQNALLVVFVSKYDIMTHIPRLILIMSNRIFKSNYPYPVDSTPAGYLESDEFVGFNGQIWPNCHFSRCYTTKNIETCFGAQSLATGASNARFWLVSLSTRSPCTSLDVSKWPITINDLNPQDTVSHASTGMKTSIFGHLW